MLTTLEQLESLYGLPHERAVRKEIPFLNEDYLARDAGASQKYVVLKHL